MSDYLEFDPSAVDKRQVYRLLTGAVVPRPIGWASTVSKNGGTNLAPFFFFTGVCGVAADDLTDDRAQSRRQREAHAHECARHRRILFQRGDTAGMEGDGGFGE